MADALEEGDQLNMDFGDSKLVQPIADKVPLRVYQDDQGTEIGFRIRKQE